MFGNSISILYSALLSDQKALQIRNRNIANADNPDYAKEEPNIETLPGVGGIKVSDIRRVSDEILHHQVLDSRSRYEGYKELENLLEGIAPYFSETDKGGLQNYTDRFFQSLQDFLREPTNVAAQKALYTEADSLVKAIRRRHDLLVDRERALLDNFSQSVEGINGLAERLGKLNKEIARAYAKSYADGKDYKYLLDQRDKLLNELSRFAGITYRTDRIGRVEVSIGENGSTAAGFIKLVDFNGEYNRLSFVGDSTNPAASYVADKNGVRWNISFFKRGLLGAYTEALNLYGVLKNDLDTLSGDLINNLYLNGLGKSLFKGNDSSDIALNFTESDLQNYDKTQAGGDADNAQKGWETAKNDLKALNADFSDALTEVRIKEETEGDLYSSLRDKYNRKVGVNLDEELSEVMKLQQHYQAVSKMVATSTRLLDYLLNSIR